METVTYSFLLNQAMKFIPLPIIISILILGILVYAYTKISFVPLKVYAKEKDASLIRLTTIQTKINDKIETIEDLNKRIFEINQDLSKYVLREDYDKQIGYLDTKMDALDDKININQASLIKEINENERRTTNNISDKVDSLYTKLIDLISKR